LTVIMRKGGCKRNERENLEKSRGKENEPKRPNTPKKNAGATDKFFAIPGGKADKNRTILQVAVANKGGGVFINSNPTKKTKKVAKRN